MGPPSVQNLLHFGQVKAAAGLQLDQGFQELCFSSSKGKLRRSSPMREHNVIAQCHCNVDCTKSMQTILGAGQMQTIVSGKSAN